MNKQSKTEKDKNKKIRSKTRLEWTLIGLQLQKVYVFLRPQRYLNYHMDKHRKGNFLALCLYQNKDLTESDITCWLSKPVLIIFLSDFSYLNFEKQKQNKKNTGWGETATG